MIQQFYYWVAWPAISFATSVLVKKISSISAEIKAESIATLASQLTELKTLSPENAGYFLIEVDSCKIVKLSDYSSVCKYYLAFLDSSNNSDNPGISISF
jgi:hypothetical protein